MSLWSWRTSSRTLRLFTITLSISSRNIRKCNSGVEAQLFVNLLWFFTGNVSSIYVSLMFLVTSFSRAELVDLGLRIDEFQVILSKNRIYNLVFITASTERMKYANVMDASVCVINGTWSPECVIITPCCLAARQKFNIWYISWEASSSSSSVFFTVSPPPPPPALLLPSIPPLSRASVQLLFHWWNVSDKNATNDSRQVSRRRRRSVKPWSRVPAGGRLVRSFHQFLSAQVTSPGPGGVRLAEGANLITGWNVTTKLWLQENQKKICSFDETHDKRAHTYTHIHTDFCPELVIESVLPPIPLILLLVGHVSSGGWGVGGGGC